MFKLFQKIKEKESKLKSCSDTRTFTYTYIQASINQMHLCNINTTNDSLDQTKVHIAQKYFDVTEGSSAVHVGRSALY